MAYVAAFMFGLATWMSNPIASGVIVFVGSLLSFYWVREMIVSVGEGLKNNQQTILREIEKRNN